MRSFIVILIFILAASAAAYFFFIHSEDKVYNISFVGSTTPLMKAISNKNSYKKVKQEMEKAVDVNAKDFFDRTALHYAAANNMKLDKETMALLKKYSVIVDSQDKDGNTPLMYAAQFDNGEAVKRLIENECDVNMRNNKGQIALMFSIANGDIQITRWLLNARSMLGTVDFNHKPAVAYARTSEMFELLMKNEGGDEEEEIRESILLFMAMDQSNNSGALSALLQKGVNVNIQDEHGNTALIYAAYYGTNGYRAHILLSYGADPKIKNTSGLSAADYLRGNQKMSEIEKAELLKLLER